MNLFSGAPGRVGVRVGVIVFADAVAIFILTWLVVRNIASLYLTSLIGYPMLLVGNYLAIWAASRQPTDAVARVGRVSKWLWFAAGVFSLNGLVFLILWMRWPAMESAVKAILGIILAGFVWHLVLRVRRIPTNPS